MKSAMVLLRPPADMEQNLADLLQELGHLLEGEADGVDSASRSSR